MTLTDPREALAEQSNFVGYLVGLAGLARMVHTLAADGDRRADPPRDADDFVHALLGLASLGDGDRATRRIRCGTAESDRRGAAARHRRRGGCDERGARTAATSSAPRCWPPPSPTGFKEWHHFVVHGAGCAAPDQLQPHQRGVSAPVELRLAPRVIVIAHDERWTGAIERFDDARAGRVGRPR